MKFVNRTTEIQTLLHYFANESNALWFVYGPKSSGKSTLLQHVIAMLDAQQYVINFLELREMLILNFQSFLNAFFPKTLSQKVKDVADGVTFNIGFFGVNLDDERLLQQNPFKLMGDKLRASKKRGKCPIIILDEIQLLKNIYLNGERQLLDELFNLFLSFTKVHHLAHIIIATSDSYFIEEIYTSAKLMQGTELYCVNHLERSPVVKWLHTEGCSDAEIEIAWKFLGGSPWELQQLLQKRQQGTISTICEFFVQEKFGKVSEFLRKMNPVQQEVCLEICAQIVRHQSCAPTTTLNPTVLEEVLQTMVAHDFWFYRADEQKITANSQSVYWAFEKILRTRGQM